jgi:predicted nucleic acid-binding protein
MPEAAPLDSVYLDTTVLSNFATSDGIATLVAFDAELCVTSAVIDELKSGVTSGHDELERALRYVDDGVAIPDEDGPTRLAEQMPWKRGAYLYDAGNAYRPKAHDERHEFFDRLDPGEAHSLYAANLYDATLATDDQDARQLAQEYGVDLTGSLGLLARAVVTGALTEQEADEHLQMWITENGYYSPAGSISAVLEQL